MRSWVWKLTVWAAVACWSAAPTGAQEAANSAGAASAAGSAATPRTAEGHPNLTGLWMGSQLAGAANAPITPSNDNYYKSDANGFDASIFPSRNGGFVNFERDGSIMHRMGTNKPMYKPEYWETVKNLDRNGNLEDPAGNCMPPGVPRIGPPAEVFQTEKEIIFLYVSQGAAAYPATYRVIPIDNRKHTNLEDLDGSWNGESIGHWEGDTLVIDTIGFNTSTWLDIEGYIHSENMHVVEKYTRDGNSLTWQATVDDPDVLLQPWVMAPRTVHLNSDPTAVIPESPPCSERDYAHAVTKEHH